MKIRMGFVSNSSTCSFMAIFAKVTDLDKAKAFIAKWCDNGVKVDEYDIVDKSNLLYLLEDERFLVAGDWADVNCRPKIEDIKNSSDDQHFLAVERFDGDVHLEDPDNDYYDADYCTYFNDEWMPYYEMVKQMKDVDSGFDAKSILIDDDWGYKG